MVAKKEKDYKVTPEEKEKDAMTPPITLTEEDKIRFKRCVVQHYQDTHEEDEHQGWWRRTKTHIRKWFSKA